MVRSNLDYCATVWNSYQKEQVKKVEMVQRREARYATNRYRNTSSVGSMLEELDWESLENRRVKLQLSLLYKVVNVLVDIPCDMYLTPMSSRTRSSHTKKFRQYSTKTNGYKYSINVINKNQIGYSIGLNSKTTSLLPDNKHWTRTGMFRKTYYLASEVGEEGRKDRKNQQGGGVLIAIKSDFISDEVEDLTPDAKSEMVWAKIEIKGSRSLYVSSFYNPKTSDEQSIKWFDTSVKRATQIKNAAILIGGDFNLPGWDWKNKILKPKSTHQNIHYDFGNTLDDTGLVQLIEYPTRKDNILDLMITNLPNQVPRIEIMPGISDHDIVFMEFKITPSKLKQTPRNVPIYNKANWETIKKK
ncbi:unnamed protein product [Mytilus edulis]|uniref:Endonuclease/exonuclease/phosphatase domain-containing protein n=1 Tax=Mytilus edulis TaxID=6550 RepID=A0A8S3SEM9_MYTED|nr:unnamed protein product [Mytilus edulis]